MSEIQRDPAFSGGGERSEQIQGHPSRNEAQIEQLQGQLADLLYPSDGGEIDVEALDALLKQMEAVSPLPASLSTEPEKALARFHRRYASIIAEADTENRQTAPSPKRYFSKSFARVLPFVAALILLSGTITAQAFGMDVFSAIARWTSEIFRLDGGSAPYASVQLHPLDAGETAVYETLEEAVAAFGIDAPIVPQEIPERFELTEVWASNKDPGILIYANYQNDEVFFKIRYREMTKEEINTFEKEYEGVASYLIEEIPHYLLSDLGRQKAVWRSGDFECSISGDLSEQEIKEIIESIYKR